MKKILVINSNYYKEISNNLVFCTKKKLLTENIKPDIINVPGVYEIPIAIEKT